jgi:hypothetical protein
MILILIAIFMTTLLSSLFCISLFQTPYARHPAIEEDLFSVDFSRVFFYFKNFFCLCGFDIALHEWKHAKVSLRTLFVVNSVWVVVEFVSAFLSAEILNFLHACQTFFSLASFSESFVSNGINKSAIEIAKNAWVRTQTPKTAKKATTLWDCPSFFFHSFLSRWYSSFASPCAGISTV